MRLLSVGGPFYVSPQGDVTLEILAEKIKSIEGIESVTVVQNYIEVFTNGSRETIKKIQDIKQVRVQTKAYSS